jgi:hypothetical protein
MCKELCEDFDEVQACQDCGRMICFDCQNGDDVMRPAFVTSSGDLYCDRCGSQHERADEEWDDCYEYDEGMP